MEIQASFRNRCAYCDIKEESLKGNLQREHLISFNKDAGGLHHPGNIVPCCAGCNKRRKEDGQEVKWKTHLMDVVKRDGHSIPALERRQKRIEDHIKNYEYPDLTDNEVAAIRTIARSLYEAVSTEVKRGTDLYWAIHEAMIRKGK